MKRLRRVEVKDGLCEVCEGWRVCCINKALLNKISH